MNNDNPEILEEIKKISIRLDKIENDISYLKKGSDNMNNHISFIENVYDTIKYPFYLIINRIHKINNLPEKNVITNS